MSTKSVISALCDSVVIFWAQLSKKRKEMISSAIARTPILGFVLFLFSIGNTFAAEKTVVVIPLGEGEFDYAKFSGPQRDLKQSLLEAQGWSVCHTSLFDDTASVVTTVLSACSGSELMLACRPADGPNKFFTLAAYAPRADVTFDTGDNLTTTRSANGSEWYFYNNLSWGFAPNGASVEKNECDSGDSETEPDYRMCIHVFSGVFDEGYRCGSIEGGQSLNGSSTWERVILHR